MNEDTFLRCFDWITSSGDMIRGAMKRKCKTFYGTGSPMPLPITSRPTSSRENHFQWMLPRPSIISTNAYRSALSQRRARCQHAAEQCPVLALPTKWSPHSPQNCTDFRNGPLFLPSGIGDFPIRRSSSVTVFPKEAEMEPDPDYRPVGGRLRPMPTCFIAKMNDQARPTPKRGPRGRIPGGFFVSELWSAPRRISLS